MTQAAQAPHNSTWRIGRDGRDGHGGNSDRHEPDQAEAGCTASRRPPRFLGLSLPPASSSWPSPPAAAVTLGRDAVAKVGEPCVVYCAEDVGAGDRRLAGDWAVRPADDFLGTFGPRGGTTNICSACLLELAFC